MEEWGTPTFGQRVSSFHSGKANASLLGDCPNNRDRFRKKLLATENLEVTGDSQESVPGKNRLSTSFSRRAEDQPLPKTPKVRDVVI